jgi:hypothetical protein
MYQPLVGKHCHYPAEPGYVRYPTTGSARMLQQTLSIRFSTEAKAQENAVLLNCLKVTINILLMVNDDDTQLTTFLRTHHNLHSIPASIEEYSKWTNRVDQLRVLCLQAEYLGKAWHQHAAGLRTTAEAKRLAARIKETEAAVAFTEARP